MKLLWFLVAIFLQLNLVFASVETDCDKFLGPSISFDDLNKKNHSITFDGYDLTITGSKVGVVISDHFDGPVRSLVFEDVRVYVSGVQSLFGGRPAHRLRGNTSALSELCSELTQGRFPHQVSDRDNEATGLLFPSRIVDLNYLDRGPSVDVIYDRISTNVFKALICSERKDGY